MFFVKLKHVVITHGISGLPVLPALTLLQENYMKVSNYDSNLNVLQICPDFLPTIMAFLLLLIRFSSGEARLLEFKECQKSELLR